ncbi:MAG: DUF4445 domain-containing protein [Lachnospiraceae bacterium]|nr:DUF4445 domain-containing protein [Lachnospiraceae bacterium]
MNKPFLAVDLGTTTIEIYIPDQESSGRFARFENPSRLYGADVLSRMNNTARFGLSEKLQQRIGASIEQNAAVLGLDFSNCSGIVLSGNTPMQHLFFGMDVSGMVDAPFTPVSLSMQHGLLQGVPVVSFPGISAFVGGDILSGLYALDLLHTDSPVLFVDLGTNGEIVLALPGEGLLASSVAAGPAFEGGNISIGMPAVSGAIDTMSIRHGFCRFHTIEESLPPKGLCGSGLIEAVYELYADGQIDRHGTYLSETFRKEGFPLSPGGFSRELSLTQKDIRHLQEAKSAICAGIFALLDASHLRESDIGRLIFAGNFGNHLDIKKASGIGLIPEALIPKTSLAGNTSLQGAIRFARHPEDGEEIASIVSRAKSLSLADSPTFKEAYIRFLELP